MDERAIATTDGGDKRKRKATTRPIAKACNECARRKARCSGGIPCASCDKNKTACEYAVANRRGPKVRKRVSATIQDPEQRATSGTQDELTSPLLLARGLDLLANLSNSNTERSEYGTTVQAPQPHFVEQLDPMTASMLSGSAAIHTQLANPQHQLPIDPGQNNAQLTDFLNPRSLPASIFASHATGSGVRTSSQGIALGQSQQQYQASHVEPAPLPVLLDGSESAYFDAFAKGQLPIESPSSESEFAQSFYETAGPGITHFRAVLSRDFNVQSGEAHSTDATHGQSSTASPLDTRIDLTPHPSDPAAPLEANVEREVHAIADSSETQAALFKIYWCFIHPQWPLLYRPAFDISSLQDNSALTNAMLSVICRYDVSRQLQHVAGTLKHIPLTSRLGEIYRTRAMAALDLANMASNLEAVQALFMLALRDVAQGYTSRGWMLAGMSIRMAYDLQLHQTARSSSLGQIAQQQRSRTIWACYTLDKTISLFLGRPSMMKYSEIDTPLPSVYETDEFNYWVEDARAVIPDTVTSFVGVQARCISTHIAWIKLLRLVEQIMDTVYAPNARTGGLRAADCAKAYELNIAIDAWATEHADIFKRATNLSSSTTNVYTLLLWYHCSRLILNRPFIPTSYLFSSTKEDKTAYALCNGAADAIVTIVKQLEKTHGIFRCSYSVIFLIFQAGVIHCLIGATAKDPLTSAKANQSLQQCMDWLDSMTETYKTSAQYRQVLLSMESLSKCELRDEGQVTQILASRLESRAASPIPAMDLAALGEIVAEDTSNPLSSLHYSFWDMPLALPLQDGNNLPDSWMNWETDYGSLLLQYSNANGPVEPGRD